MKMNITLIASLVLGLSTGGALAEGTDHLKFKDVEAEWKHRAKQLEIELETQAPVPMDGKAGAFGYGALTDGANNVLVLTTHLPIDDSSHEQLPSGFHTHVLDLQPPTPACAGASFEVDLPGSSRNAAFDAKYAWLIQGAKVELKGAPAADLGDAGVESRVSFTIKPILDAQQKPVHLCVTVVDQI
ncbi:MAG: hypothetical protein ACKN9W_19750 [Methylococcus sp.]